MTCYTFTVNLALILKICNTKWQSINSQSFDMKYSRTFRVQKSKRKWILNDTSGILMEVSVVMCHYSVGYRSHYQ